MKATRLVPFLRGIVSWRHNEIPTVPVYKSEREEVEDAWDVEAICKKNHQKKEDYVKSKICR